MTPATVLDLRNADAIALYAVLASHANRDTGECWPSMKRLEECMGCTENRIRPALKRLVDAGFVSVHKRQLHGMDQSNIYRISAEVRVPSDRVAVPCQRVMGTLSEGDGSPVTGYEQEPTELEPKEQEIYAPGSQTTKVATYSEEFERFWQAYPKGRGTKLPSFKHWKRMTNEQRNAAFKALPFWKASWTEPQYIPYCEKWLGERRWEGDPPPPKRSSNPNAGGQRRWVEG